MAQDPRPAQGERPSRPGTRVGVAVSSFHSELTGAMLDSARRELEAGGVRPEDVRVVWTPGSFELPLVARRLARRADIDAVLCLGLVLKGETTHDEHVARGSCEGIQRVMLETDKPVLLGVLTCQTLEQARARALPAAAEEGQADGRQGGRHDGHHDKGREVARAALELLASLDSIEDLPARSVGFPHPEVPRP